MLAPARCREVGVSSVNNVIGLANDGEIGCSVLLRAGQRAT